MFDPIPQCSSAELLRFRLFDLKTKLTNDKNNGCENFPKLQNFASELLSSLERRGSDPQTGLRGSYFIVLISAATVNCNCNSYTILSAEHTPEANDSERPVERARSHDQTVHFQSFDTSVGRLHEHGGQYFPAVFDSKSFIYTTAGASHVPRNHPGSFSPLMAAGCLDLRDRRGHVLHKHSRSSDQTSYQSIDKNEGGHHIFGQI